MPRYVFTQEDSSRGGQALVEKRGKDHMSKIGRRGFAATVKKHFQGNAEAMTDWLSKKGRWAIDREVTTYTQKFPDPGPHPSQVADIDIEKLPF